MEMKEEMDTYTSAFERFNGTRHDLRPDDDDVVVLCHAQFEGLSLRSKPVFSGTARLADGKVLELEGRVDLNRSQSDHVRLKLSEDGSGVFENSPNQLILGPGGSPVELYHERRNGNYRTPLI